MKGQDAKVEILVDKHLPKGGWKEGVLANDSCIYYLPYVGDSIVKLDPKTDSILIIKMGIHFIVTRLLVWERMDVFMVFPNEKYSPLILQIIAYAR